ncbi:PREDICTED: rab11 family-interacting protein 2 [Ceratosolen solmsi marchali]|uniref:Rab11 family-interacting protein 2 n=1 Tax=Ceratosolen solmsi marchali TaxID=326594 RepID=A0AAJ6YS51_9HYME|nr:PREDICTED: rab11 family-interacting protein 2 [Ceratosolen solmsi marchali]
MWSPTHVQVIVQRAKGLITKGKNRTNDCFVTIALGKEKYQTSVKEKASENVEWHEECELQIPQQGNTAEIILTTLHRNFIGVDEFLGTVRIPLSSFDIYEMPRNRWYELSGKPGKENTKERGKLEVRICFIVRAGSLTDLTKKERHKSSLGQLSSVAQSFGGSLLSIASLEKRKGLKKLAKSIGGKVRGKSQNKNKLDDICDEEEIRVGERPRTAGQEHGDADPGVISDEDDDFTFDDLSHKSSTSSLNSSATPNNTWKNNEVLTRDNRNNTSRPGTLGIYIGSDNRQSETQTVVFGSTPPSKPPRFVLGSNGSGSFAIKSENQQQQGNIAEDEWGQKLYGFQTGSALKRWENKQTSPKIVIEGPHENTDTTVSERSTSPRSSPITRLSNEISDSLRIQQMRKDKDKHKFIKEAERKERAKEKGIGKPSSERIIIGGEESASQAIQPGRFPREISDQFDGKSREDLIELVLQLQLDVSDQKKRLHDLEDYIDSLLLRVIESSPRLLQNPYQPTRRLSSPGHQ